EGGRAAVPWLVAHVEHRGAPVSVEPLCAAVARAPVREALAPLRALLEADSLFARRPRTAPAADSPAADRVRGLAQAIAAIDRAAAQEMAERAPAPIRPLLEAGMVDDAVRRLAAAPPEVLPALRAELRGHLPLLVARCEGGDA